MTLRSALVTAVLCLLCSAASFQIGKRQSSAPGPATLPVQVTEKQTAHKDKLAEMENAQLKEMVEVLQSRVANNAETSRQRDEALARVKELEAKLNAR